MRTILLAGAVWLLTAVVGYGQVDSSVLDAIQRHNEGAQRSSDEYAQKKYMEALELGRSLFGADERWKDKLLQGTLAAKTSPNYKIGDWGCTRCTFQMLSKVSKTECLVKSIYGEPKVTLLLRGWDTSKVVDDVQFVLQYPVVISTTYDSTSARGTKKTVLVLERNSKSTSEIIEDARAAKEKQVEERRKAADERARVEKERKDAIEAAKWHTWTDATGEHHIEAKFGGLVAGNVKLIKRDGSVLKLPLEKLSDEDQEWIKHRK